MYQVGYFLTRNSTMFPDRVAVIHDGRKITYKELNVAANRLANHFLEMGMCKGDRVGFLLSNSIEIVILWYATPKIGVAAMPINLRLLPDEVSHIINDAQCRALVYSEKYLDLAITSLGECPCVQYLLYKGDGSSGLPGTDIVPLILDGDSSEPAVDVSGDDESVILYTSGTTGRSKGVMHTQQMVREYSYMMALETDPPNKPATVLVQSPMFHLGGMQHIWRMAILGGTLVLVNKIIPEEIFDCIQKYAVTEFYLLPPILIKRLYDYPDWRKYDLSSLKTVMCTGGKCSMDISEMIFELFPNAKIRLSYGSTEVFGPTTAFVTRQELESRPELATTVGKLNNQVEMRLVDRQMHDVPDGTPGEALVRSPMLFKGYLNLPELNKKAFEEDGWFHTEDVLYRTEDGYYFVVDRIKDMIKTGGENVFAQEVESIIRDFDDVFDCAVIGIPDPEMGEGVAAAIVTYDGKRLDGKAFLDECRRKMPSYRKPRYWTFMKELPTNSIGKIQKSILREHPEWFERIE